MKHPTLFSSKELHMYYLRYGVDSVITLAKLREANVDESQVQKWEQFRDKAICLAELWETVNRRSRYAR